MTDRVFYSVKEFLRRNSVGKTKFFSLVKSGAITTVKVGTRTLVPAESERAWHETLVRRTVTPNCTHKSVADLGEPKRTAPNRG